MSCIRRLWLFLFFLVVSAAALADPQLIDDAPAVLVYPPFLHTPLGIHRGTPDLLALLVGQRTRFTGPEGLACTRLLSRLREPPNPDDCQLTVLGANTGLGHLIYNPSLTRLEVLGDRGPAAGWLRRPTGVALYPDGSGCVTDPAQKRVFRLRWQDDSLLPDGELPAPPGGWREPWGTAFSSDKYLYVSDAGLDQIAVFSPDGRLQRLLGPDLGSQVRLSGPRAICIADASETWSFYHDDYLYICDQAGRRILRVNPKAGTNNLVCQATLSSLPGDPAIGQFSWMDLDYYENLWVTDSVRCQIHKFDRHLRYLASYGRPGSGDGQFQRPTGIAIYRHYGQVFVAEEQGAHYFWIGTDVLNPSVQWQDPGANLVKIRFSLPEPSRFSLEVRDSRNDAAQVVMKNQNLDSGPQELFWRLSERHPDQTLLFTFVAEATYSSAQYFAKRVRVTFQP